MLLGLRFGGLGFRVLGFRVSCPRSPGAHIVGPWVMDSTNLYRDVRTGTQYIGNWSSWDAFGFKVRGLELKAYQRFQVVTLSKGGITNPVWIDGDLMRTMSATRKDSICNLHGQPCLGMNT